MVFNDSELEEEIEWIGILKERKIPVITILNKIDIIKNIDVICNSVKLNYNLTPIIVSAKDKIGMEKIRERNFATSP